MKVQVRLFAVFREGRFRKKDLDFPDGASVNDVLSHLEIPTDHIGILLVNGQGAPRDAPLSNNDIIAVFPAVGGG